MTVTCIANVYMPLITGLYSSIYVVFVEFQDKEGRSELKLEKSSSVTLQYKFDRGETYRYVSQIKEKLPIICVKVNYFFFFFSFLTLDKSNPFFTY